MNRIPATQARLLTMLLTLTFALCVLVPASALAIPRTTVLARAHTCVKKPVKYSQSKYHLGYRTDCSGYVSMCWDTKRSWSTATFYRVTHRITRGELRPGDAMLKPGYHVRLFHHWLNRRTRATPLTSPVTQSRGPSQAQPVDRFAGRLRSHSLQRSPREPTCRRRAVERPFDAWSGLWGAATSRSHERCWVGERRSSPIASHAHRSRLAATTGVRQRIRHADRDLQIASVTADATLSCACVVRMMGDPTRGV
jgi:hypothetical protein